MQIKLRSERGRESDKVHELVDREMPVSHESYEQSGWFAIGDSLRGKWGWKGPVRDIGLDGNYEMEIMLSQNDIANLVRIAWGSKPFAEFITAMSPSAERPSDRGASNAPA